MLKIERNLKIYWYSWFYTF